MCIVGPILVLRRRLALLQGITRQDLNLDLFLAQGEAF